MARQFRPSLAVDASWEYFEQLFSEQNVMFASPKLDGIRAVVLNGQLVSRTLKPIRNRYIQSLLGRPEYEGLDGELVVGDPFGEGVFARTSSGVMSEFGQPDFTYHIFDNHVLGRSEDSYFVDRWEQLINNREDWDPGFMALLPQSLVMSIWELEEIEAQFVDQQYEGVILRWSHSPYKQGRSTLRERYMLKLKRFTDSEAEVVGFQELMHNDNEATIDSRGYTARGSSKDNKRAGGTLGALLCRDLHRREWEFAIGTGFDASLRAEIWENQDDYFGKIVKYTYLAVGTIDRPRHPVYRGFRDRDDLDGALTVDTTALAPITQSGTTTEV